MINFQSHCAVSTCARSWPNNSPRHLAQFISASIPGKSDIDKAMTERVLFPAIATFTRSTTERNLWKELCNWFLPRAQREPSASGPRVEVKGGPCG